MIKRVLIVARHHMVNEKLWGLTLLERNLRELEIIGIEEAVVVTLEELQPLSHFKYSLPKKLTVSFKIANSSDVFESLRSELQNTDDLILVLEGNSLNDRRILIKLIKLDFSFGVISPVGNNRGSAAILSKSEVLLFLRNSSQNLTSILSAALKNSKLQKLNLENFEKHIIDLRREIDPFLILVQDSKQLEEADRFLSQTVEKGVNDFVAKYIHPPLEFGAVRLLLSSPITPNQITFFWIFLAALTVPLLATGQLLLGLFLAAARNILDGIDGKLARLTLRFSKAGDLLDHVTDTLYDGAFYLTLGWYFSGGDLNSTAANFTFILFISYCVEKIVPGVFKKIQKVEIYDYKAIDRFIRLVGSRINNNVWILLLGTLLGLGKATFFAVSIWMLMTA
ncbi:MAG: CDP-alcohol phosphatidyltransferase family protein, partial [Bacteroidetes bacterium]|nr:CDP-alcohol phosphatidyltransferase family protein [Bacteroidota bacterium]